MISNITLERLRLPHIADNPQRPSGIWGRIVTFDKGTRYIVRAESGSGKSSLCDFIFGNRCDYSGKLLFDGTDTRHFTPERWCELRRSSIAYLSQEARLFPHLTVEENIEIKNRLTGHRSHQWITRALEQLEVADKLHWNVDRLSVGQRQRVAAIRALCQPFDFLLFDEPVSHLDSERAIALATLVDETAATENAAVIITSVGSDLPLPALSITL